MGQVITGKHLLLALSHTNFDVPIEAKIETVCGLIGCKVVDLVRIINNDFRVPTSYLEKMEEGGIKALSLDDIVLVDEKETE